MESSHLTLAHDHAKAASIATQTSDTTVAINEHTLAAGEFAKAAGNTSSHEALRTLKLLEQHHKRLSELLKFPIENPVTKSNIADTDLVSTSEKNVPTSAAVSELRSPKADTTISPPRRAAANAPGLQVPRRMPPREMSSSIASNLASARGIRSSHDRRALSPSVTAVQAPGSLETHIRKSSRPARSPEAIPEEVTSKPSWVPPVGAQQASTPTKTAQDAPTGNEEGFQRFYSTFENIISKISAPLAFAGLPLISEEPSAVPPSTTPSKESPNRQRRPPSIKQTSTDPDLSKFISSAALRASAHQTSGNDSFYVVPTSGHTVSYASILSFAEKEKRRMAASLHSENPDLFEDPDNEDFVDARETPLQLSPGYKARVGPRKTKSGKELENVVEELYTENKSLKDCIDKLSRRLHAFEMAAQSSNLALQESMRLIRPASPAVAPSASGSKNEVEAKLTARLRSLEEQVDTGDKEIQRLSKENDKLKSVVTRYRERWEKLKEGAKTRREASGSKEQQAPSEASGKQ